MHGHATAVITRLEAILAKRTVVANRVRQFLSATENARRVRRLKSARRYRATRGIERTVQHAKKSAVPPDNM